MRVSRARGCSPQRKDFPLHDLQSRVVLQRRLDEIREPISSKWPMMTDMLTSNTCKCSICARPLSLHQWYSGGVCADWRCLERVLHDALLAKRAEAARVLGVENATEYTIVVVPLRILKLVPLAEERRRTLAQYLTELLAAMPAEENSGAGECEPVGSACGSARESEVDRLLAAVCGVCQGFCCHHGGTRNAFLDAETMTTFRADHPGMPDEDVVAAYLNYLPSRVCQGSCVYHTPVGCALPRPMRASICNTYECRGLRDARQIDSSGACSRACVVVRHDNRIVDTAFVEVPLRG